jgi:hypothetical protein
MGLEPGKEEFLGMLDDLGLTINLNKRRKRVNPRKIILKIS